MVYERLGHTNALLDAHSAAATFALVAELERVEVQALLHVQEVGGRHGQRACTLVSFDSIEVLHVHSNMRLTRSIRLLLREHTAQLHHLDVLLREGRGLQSLRSCKVARFLALLGAQLQVVVHIRRGLLERVRVSNLLRVDGLAQALQLGTERLLRLKVIRNGLDVQCVMLATRVMTLHTLRVVAHLVLIVATHSALISRANERHGLLE